MLLEGTYAELAGVRPGGRREGLDRPMRLRLPRGHRLGARAPRTVITTAEGRARAARAC